MRRKFEGGVYIFTFLPLPIQKKEFKHRLHQMHSLIVDAKDMIDVTAMDVSFGSTGSAHILPWMCTTVRCFLIPINV